jgi:Na+/H+ antiporter NhaD/arsenite permease-like protein
MQNIVVIKRYYYTITDYIKSEIVFLCSFILAVATSFIITPKIEYLDFKVLLSLFNLMIVIAAFKKLHILDKAAVKMLKKYNNSRTVSLILILITFFSSMLVTNDVALITFVPLTLIIGAKSELNVMNIIILQTIAANIGSSLTPMGNPQNLFIYSHYNINPFVFFKITFPLAGIGAAWLIIINLNIKNKLLSFSLEEMHVSDKKRMVLYSILFMILILSIFNIINYVFSFFLTAFIMLYFDRDLIKQVDFFLLATFICFFVFIGNLSHLDFIRQNINNLLSYKGTTYFVSIILSQFISNVPCSILLSTLTNNWRELLLGVNVGGMGTLIASLASVISYKLYINSDGKENSS